MILYINACVRGEGSRTDRLARALLSRLGEYTEVKLSEEPVAPFDKEVLARRDAFIEAGDLGAEMFRYARQFAAADTIVMAAPYWDLSYPAILKMYLENLYIMGIVSEFLPDGSSVGLCRAKHLYYVTTAGGKYDPRFSYEHVSALVKNCFGVQETSLIYAEMLDVVGYDPEAILRDCEAEIRALAL